MSNLRSDCRDIIKRNPKMKREVRVHFEAALNQIDQIEEYWHEAGKANLILDSIIDGYARWEWLGESKTSGELCFGGLRYAMNVDHCGRVQINEVVLSRLREWRRSKLDPAES